ncbi:MAG: hypothetical protein ACE5IT_06455 [bacterium]
MTGIILEKKKLVGDLNKSDEVIMLVKRENRVFFERFSESNR